VNSDLLNNFAPYAACLHAHQMLDGLQAGDESKAAALAVAFLAICKAHDHDPRKLLELVERGVRDEENVQWKPEFRGLLLYIKNEMKL
jgi:hypothetical protein